MEKKNILFVMPSLSAGGGEKSLVNLLSQIDYESYNVDLFLFNKSGLFINFIPESVKLLSHTLGYRFFTKKLFFSILYFIKLGKVNIALSRLKFTIYNRFLIKESANCEQYTWKYMSRSIDILEKEYDAAIGYLEKSSIYFVIDKVKSKKKIGWIHTNYSNSGLDKKHDNPYFKQLDNIVTVSEECAKSLQDNFESLKNKVKIISNIISPKIIFELSKMEIQDNSKFNKDYINILTIARLSYEKGIDLAIKSCKILIDKGYKVKWYVLGDGNEKSKLESLIASVNLTDYFKLIGLRENPYPYITNADIYVQPSRYEGKSIAIDEAKVLQKPIVVTNFDTAKDQIIHRKTGIIVDKTEGGISLGIETLINDVNLKNNLINNLSKEELGNEAEINYLYQLF